MAEYIAKVIKNRSEVLFLVKLFIILAAFVFIYNKLFAANGFALISEGFASVFSFHSILLLLSVPLLGVFNWGLEALKWKYISGKFQPLDFMAAYKGVITGIPIGLITPNRIGEYGGRIIYLNRENRIKGIVGAVTGNISQMLATCLFSLPGLFIFFSGNQYSYLKLPALVLAVLLVIFYFAIRKLPEFLKSKVFRFLAIVKQYKTKYLSVLLLLSSIRYLVFLAQFYLLLSACDVALSLKEVFVFLPLVFLAISIIPGFALTEWGIRGSASLFFIGSISSNHAGILAAATLLWIFNIALPALFGTVFLAKVQIEE
jgi:hypothetical protein